MNIEALKAKAIFLEAIELPHHEEWPAYIAKACGEDSELRRRVERLLEAHAETAGAVDRFALRPERTTDHPSSIEGPGTVIGPYTLREQIGEGGMGVVYVAEQSHPVRRKVALKVIKPGMDTKQVVARFEAERQALAMMDHLNIAKVHDGGTTESGRPYFVMELVPGVPITEYCDGERLSVRQRLELFVLVCRAVQHAHQKGIIHRDLKPSNILVTLHDGVPVPKVIDFGVAKAMGQSLTDKTVYTALSQLVGTPLYMSPEQAEMNQLGVDTRSDVYSLGVLLYELLTGTTPFDKETLGGSGLEEMRRMIREDEPPRPSARVSSLQPEALSTTSQRRSTDPRRISAALHGELDWIVMKSLEKDRSRRYESASAFATDVQRYLDDEPVLASPPSTMYKFHKFARKHRAALATAVAIAASLILGTTASAWQAVRATTAEAQANANATLAQTSAQEAREKAQEAGAQRDEAKQQRDEAQKQRDEVTALNEKLVAKEQQLQRTLYASHINLAQHAWEAGRIGRVVQLLEQHRPKAGESDLRGFEWYYLYRLCHGDLLTLEGHIVGAPADRSVAFSPDGKRVASATGARMVKVWDARTGQELLSLKGGGDNVAFSPDGKRLASGRCVYSPGEVKVWDAQTGAELLSLEDSTTSVAFSPDGKRLASGSGSVTNPDIPVEVKVRDAQTGRELLSLKGHSRHIISVAFSPDGKRLASGDGKGTVKVWDAQSGQELLSFQFQGDRSVAFSPDGKRLASASGEGVKVWDAQTGQEILSFQGSGNAAFSVAFSPDGERLAGGSRGVKVWDAQTGKELLTFQGHTGVVNSVVFSPDGSRLASGAMDGTVKIWDATTSPEARTFKARNARGVVFSPDGKRLAGGGAYDETVKAHAVNVWDAQTGQELLSLTGNASPIPIVAYSPDGKRLASGSGTWDATKRAFVSGEVKLWDAQTGQDLLTLKGHTAMVVSVAFSPDGKHLASGSGDDTNRYPPRPGEVKVWDAQTGKELLSLQGGRSVAFSPDGKRLASASGEGVKVWDAQTGQEILILKVRTGGAVAFSPDGKRLASSTYLRRSSEIKVWDAQTGQELLTFEGNTGSVFSVAFSPDGKRLTSSTGPFGEVKVWDAQTGLELLTLKGGGFGSSLAFSPDGHRLVSAAGSTTGGSTRAREVRIYDATPLPEKP